MERQDLIAFLKQAILDNGDKLPDLVITEETKITDLGLSSLSFVELIFAIEEKFDITIEMNAATPIETIGTFIDCIQQELGQK